MSIDSDFHPGFRGESLFDPLVLDATKTTRGLLRGALLASGFDPQRYPESFVHSAETMAIWLVNGLPEHRLDDAIALSPDEVIGDIVQKGLRHYAYSTHKAGISG